MHGPFASIEDAQAAVDAWRKHQQYLDKNPNGYCGLGGTGVSCPVGVDLAETEKRDR